MPNISHENPCSPKVSSHRIRRINRPRNYARRIEGSAFQNETTFLSFDNSFRLVLWQSRTTLHKPTWKLLWQIRLCEQSENPDKSDWLVLFDFLTDYRSVKGAELKNTMGRCRLPFPSLSPIPLAASPLVHYGRASSQAKRAITPRTKDLNGDPAHNMKQSSILILFVVCEVS